MQSLSTKHTTTDMKRILILCCLILFSLTSFAQKKAVNLAELTENAYTTFYDKEGYLWIGTDNGLLRFDGYTVETFRTDRNNPDMFQSNDILTICENTDKNELWLGTKKGAYILSKKDFTVSDLKLRGGKGPESENDLSDKRVTGILRGSDGSYWLAYRNCLFHLDKDSQVKQLYHTQWKGKDRSVSYIIEDPSKTIWIVLWNGGIQRLKQGDTQFSDCEWTDAAGPNWIGFNPDKQQMEATSESGNRYRFRLDGHQLQGPDTGEQASTEPAEEQADKLTGEIPLNENILCVTPLKNCYHWVGTTRGIYTYQPQTKALENKVNGTGPVHDICIDSNGHVFFVNNANGICTFKKGQLQTLAESSGLSSLTTEGDSVLWAGSKMGYVFRFRLGKGEELHDDTIAGNMNGDPILKVRADQKGRLWVLSSNHLKEYSTKTGGCKIVTSQQLETGEFTTFYLLDDGVKVVGKGKSANVEETRQLGQERAVSRTAVSSYTLDGKHNIFTCDTLHIDSKAHSLTLFLTAFAFDTPRDITFAYRINDDDWSMLDKGENILTFQQIPYGDSHIEVKAMDNYGQWSQPQVVATLVHPRPWYTYLWIPILLAAAFAGFFYYRHYRKKEKARYAARIRRYESEKEELQHKLEAAERRAEEIGYKQEEPEEEQEQLPPADQQFLDKARQLIMQNLSNVAYNVDALSSDLCMSRMSLYRRIKDILHKSPTDLIRETRLEQAEMLLKTTDYSVNEISDLCGFSYPSYFTKCFKERYGKAPKEYR